MKIKYTILYEYSKYKTFAEAKKNHPELNSRKDFEEMCSKILLKEIQDYLFVAPDDIILEIKTKIIDD